MATVVIGTAGLEVTALPEFVSVEDEEEVARAAMMEEVIQCALTALYTRKVREERRQTIAEADYLRLQIQVLTPRFPSLSLFIFPFASVFSNLIAFMPLVWAHPSSSAGF